MSLEKQPPQAVGFYSVIGIAIGTGLVLNFLHIDPVKALFWAAILNGLVAAPLGHWRTLAVGSKLKCPVLLAIEMSGLG